MRCWMLMGLGRIYESILTPEMAAQTEFQQVIHKRNPARMKWAKHMVFS